MDRRRFVFGAAVAGSTLLAGCGGSGDAPSEATTGEGGEATGEGGTGGTADDEFENTQPAQGTEQRSIEGGVIGGEGPTTIAGGGSTDGPSSPDTSAPSTLTETGNTTN